MKIMIKESGQRTARVAETAAVQLKVDGSIARVVFNDPVRAVNVLSSRVLRDLEAVIGRIETMPHLRCVCFCSAKQKVFIAGADLAEVLAVDDRESLIDLGQRVFSRVEDLSAVTIAIIHGACVGGGFELALACDYRVASNARETRIGLPEVRLGLIPAWGGSTRLPRLIGLRKAMELILSGRTLSSRQALSAGLINAEAPRERLEALALRHSQRGKRRNFVQPADRMLAFPLKLIAKSGVRAKTRGNYPAPLAAVDVLSEGVRKDTKGSLRLEKQTILELGETDVCRNLIGAFFMEERAKHLAAPGAKPVERCAVFGAGVMGAGIAQWLSARGKHVLVRDLSPQLLAKGLAHASRLYHAAEDKGVVSPVEVRQGMDRIHPAEIAVPLKGVDLVIEAVVEKLSAKKQLFRELELHASPHAVLATNTSALSISEIASGARHPERIIGLHFFNPVHKMSLVEIVRGERSSPETISTAVAFVQEIGKLPLVVRDRPGFLVNRILMPYLLEAASLYERGVAAHVIDDAMLDFGMPMGPLRLLDEVGLDIASDVAETLCQAFSGRLEVPELLDKMLDAGFRGRKTGAGFYRYGGRHASENAAVRRLQRTGQHVSKAEIAHRLALLMINEGARCLEEEVVATAAEADLGMIFGTGFAPFRGGPLRYADALGLGAVHRELEQLESVEGLTYSPCSLIRIMDEQGRSFYEECRK